MRTALLLLLVACGSAPAPPANAAPPTTPARTDRLGTLAIVPAPTGTTPVLGFVPIADAAAVVPADPDAAPPPRDVAVLDARGTLARLTGGTAQQVPFGCDGHRLDVVAYRGTSLHPGAAWIPEDLEPRPTAIPIRVVEARDALQRFDVGALRIVLARDAQRPLHGTLSFLAGERTIHVAPFARTLVEGADASMATLHFGAGGPAIPMPVAAWSLEGGAALVVFERKGWEGTSLEAWLVDAASATQIEAMTVYLYQCAF